MQPTHAFWDAYRRPGRKAVLVPLLALQVCVLAALIWLPHPVGLYLQEFVTLVLLVTALVAARERYVRLRRHVQAMKDVHSEHERELRGLLRE